MGYSIRKRQSCTPPKSLLISEQEGRDWISCASKLMDIGSVSIFQKEASDASIFLWIGIFVRGRFQNVITARPETTALGPGEAPFAYHFP
jgi:hypothetical protein